MTADPAGEQAPLVRVVRPDGGPARVIARGEIDLANVADLRTALHDVAGPGGGVLVDLRDVTYLDSAGITALFEHADGELEVILAAESPLSRVIEIVGLDRVARVRTAERQR